MKCLLLFFLTLHLISCTSNSCEQHFTFEFPMKVTPQDTFNIGDTIWYEMQLSQNILDNNSGDYIDLGNFELYFEIAMTRWDTTQRNSITNFKIVEEIGIIKQNINTFAFTYLEFANIANRHLKFGLVPMSTGRFSTTVEFPIELYEKEHLPLRDPERFHLTNSNCSQFMVSSSGVKVNEGKINYHLVDGLCQQSAYSGDTVCIAPYDKVVTEGTYAFVVQ